MSEFRFGHPGQYEVGSIFDSRKALSDTGIHGPPMHGIWGCVKEKVLAQSLCQGDMRMISMN